MATSPDANRAIHRQFIRYLTTGILSCGLDLGLFWWLYTLVHLPWVVANTGAMFVTLGFNFLLNRHWSFASVQPVARQVRRYAMLVVANMLLSNVIIYILSDLFTFDRILAKGFAIAMIASWNFLIYRYVVYC
jgi:putative flippase GtrA